MTRQDADLLSVTNIEREFDGIPDVHKGLYLSTDAVKNQIAWLEYVPEYEFTESECEHVRLAARRLYVALRRLTNKYID